MAKTLTEDVYEKLRADIINLRMAPGEKVSEAKLAERFQVSRAPIRSVIERLRAENLVIVKPQIGTIISPVSLDRALDVMEVRLLLEPQAAASAAARIGEADMAELRRQVERLAAATGEREAAINTEVDGFIHETVWRNCGNAEIAAILNGYRGIIERIQHASVSSTERLVPSLGELTTILEALAAKDADGAFAAMRAHLVNVQRSVRIAVLDG